MQSSLEPIAGTALAPSHLPKVPWRDPHSVPPAELAAFIEQLQASCRKNPKSADLRICLGMAYAMNYDVYGAMDALEEATLLDPVSFFARLKYGELFFRIRALTQAEAETIKALNLAANPWELSQARKQLQEIRSLAKAGNVRPVLLKPLLLPGIGLLVMLLASAFAMGWRP